MTKVHRFDNGKILWKCDICKKKGFWNDSWWTYGDDELRAEDTPTLCSDTCKEDFDTKMKLKIIEVPRVVYRGYTAIDKAERKGY